MSSQPLSRTLTIYTPIEQWSAAAKVDRRALLDDLAAYAERVRAKPYLLLRELSFDEVPTVSDVAKSCRDYCGTWDVEMFWCRRIWPTKTALYRKTILNDLLDPRYYNWFSLSLKKEAELLEAKTAGDTEPYNGKENWLDAWQDETPLSLSQEISAAVTEGIKSDGLDLVMPFGSQIETAFQWAFGPLSNQYHTDSWYRYPESVPPKPPPHFTWKTRMAFSHVAPVSALVPGSQVLHTWDPAGWHKGWTVQAINLAGMVSIKPPLPDRMIYTSSWSDLRGVMTALRTLP